MASYFPGFFSNLFSYRMFIQSHDRIHLRLIQEFMCFRLQRNTFYGIFLGKTFRSANNMMAVVRTWTGYIMLNQNSFSFLRLNQCGIHVTYFIGLFGFFRIGSESFFGIFSHPDLFSGHGYQIIHFIPSVNIHNLTDRPQSMGRIRISGMFLVIFQTPHSLITALFTRIEIQ